QRARAYSEPRKRFDRNAPRAQARRCDVLESGVAGPFLGRAGLRGSALQRLLANGKNLQGDCTHAEVDDLSGNVHPAASFRALRADSRLIYSKRFPLPQVDAELRALLGTR